jgi:8-oxo-dGTP diphosphatase
LAKERNGEHIHVACAIIEHDGLVLAAQRKEGMRMALKWEFPGGKIDPGESPEECVKRELVEELGVTVTADRPLDPVTHRYSFFTVTLYPFVCTILSGEITLHEHAAILWLPPDALPSLDWAEADIPLIDDYVASRRVLQGKPAVP